MVYAEGNSHDAGSGLPSEDQVRAALDRMMSHPAFGASKRRAEFLRYIVEEALAGRAQELKGYTIATAVFERDESFDSRTDPVVRLEARRLRQDLDSYYVGPGAADPIRISIPKGGYAPLFEVREEMSPAPAPRAPEESSPGSAEPAQAFSAPRRRVWGRSHIATACVVLVVALLLAVAWISRSDMQPADPLAIRGNPRIVVIPFDAINATNEAVALSAGLGAQLVHDLRRFEDLRVFQPPAGSDLFALAARQRAEPGAVYAIYGQVYAAGARARIDANLRNLRTDEVIWSDTYDVALAPGALDDLRALVAGNIATALGQAYGPIGDDLGRRNATARPKDVASYLCVLKAYEHRRNFEAGTYRPTLACLESAVARDPNYSDAWAMLGWLHLDAGRFDFPGVGSLETEYALAQDAARRALALAPDNVLALRALASILFYEGNYDESERLARRAVALNPYDPEALVELGWRLAVRGNFDEGVPLLHDAVRRSVDPPGWYFHLLAIDYLMKGDYAGMRGEAERAALSGGPVSEALLAIAAGGLGDRETARAALSRIPPAWDAETTFRRHGSIDEIVAALMGGLETARRLAEDPADP